MLKIAFINYCGNMELEGIMKYHLPISFCQGRTTWILSQNGIWFFSFLLPLLPFSHSPLLLSTLAKYQEANEVSALRDSLEQALPKALVGSLDICLQKHQSKRFWPQVDKICLFPVGQISSHISGVAVWLQPFLGFSYSETKLRI